MYNAAMRMAQPGVWEQDIAGRMEGIASPAARPRLPDDPFEERADSP
jgi:hypothetical protein